MSTLSIPAFHVSDPTKVKGGGDIFITSRQDATSSGVFTVKIDVHFDPVVEDFPTGSLTIRVDLNDGAKGTFIATSFELINSYGKQNPTAYLTGRCNDDIAPDAKGCRYWLMIANNKSASAPGTPDVVGFAVHDKYGTRIAYGTGGTGPVRSGDFDIMPK